MKLRMIKVIDSDFLLKQQCGNSASQVAVVKRCHLPARCKDLILVSIPPCPTLVPQVPQVSNTSAAPNTNATLRFFLRPWTLFEPRPYTGNI